MHKTLLVFITLFLLTSPLSFASEALKNIHPINIETTDDFTDLRAFGTAIGDKSIVFLDELTHGEKEVFALKSRIVQYLHQHKGFEVLILESGIYDVSRIWKNNTQAIKSQAPGNIFYMYARDKSMETLFDYIDNHRNKNKPLHLAGFDNRLSGQYSNDGVVNHIEVSSKKFLSSAIKNFNWLKHNKMTQNIVERNAEKLSDKEQGDYLKQSYYLYDQLNNLTTTQTAFNSPQYTAKLIQSIIRVAENLWGTRRHDEHDLAMAENTRWLLDNAYKDKKVIIWGHYIHLNRQGAYLSRWGNLSTELHQDRADDIYIAHFGAASGSYKHFIDMKVKTIAALDKHSFENALTAYFQEQQKPSALFIGSDDLNPTVTQGMTVFGHEYNETIPIKYWKNHWDGMFLINSVTPAK